MRWFKEHLDPKYVKVCAYAGVTALLVFAAGMLIYNSSSTFASTWSLVQKILQPILWGGIICYILLPVVRWVDARLASIHLIADDTRRLYASVAITLAVVALAIVGIVALLLLVVTRSLEGVSFESLQAIVESLGGDIDALIDQIMALAAEAGLSLGEDATSTITGAVSRVAGYATTTVFSIIFGIYFLLDGESVFKYFARLFRAMLGRRRSPDFAHVMEDADHAFSGYIRGQFLDGLLVGSITTIVFAIIDVPYWPVIGVLTGIGNLIPYVGGPVGFGTTIIVCLVQGSYEKLIAGVVALAVIMFIDGNIINPRLVANAVEVHPLLVVAALIAGSALGGLAGMLVAVPSAAFIKAQVDRWVDAREAMLGEDLSGPPAEPR